VLTITRFRQAAVVGLALSVTALWAGPATAKQSGPPVNPTQPCGYLTTAMVKKALGGPVTLDPTNRGNPVPNACEFLIGADAASPTAVLIVTNQYPGLGTTPGQDAVDLVESQEAIDSQGGYETITVGVGKSGYINQSLASLYDAPTRQFAFQLHLLLANGPPTGGPLSAANRKAFVTLAKSIAARSPKS